MNEFNKLKTEYEANKLKFEDDEFFELIYNYEIQRLKGNYNMITEANKVMSAIKCKDEDKYFELLFNYSHLMEKYFPEYCKIFF